MSYQNTLTTEAAFARYEAIRARLPGASFPASSLDCPGLDAVAEHVDAFVLDSFGVLNVGETPVPGAVERMARLRAMGKRLIVLTNAASTPRSAAIAKYRRLGFDFAPEEVVSSRDICTARLDAVMPGARWGAIAAREDTFEDIPADVTHWDGRAAVDGFVVLSSADLTGDLLTALARALSDSPRPLVIANPDLVAPRENGLSQEPGFYAHALADQLGIAPIFFGKPFGDAFDDALARLEGIPRHRIAMVGDTLHTDILGGAAAGLRTVLVRDHGLFAGHAVGRFVSRAGIVPDFSTATI